MTTADASISPIQVIGTGATDIRKVFTAEEIPIILRAYVKGIQTALIVSVALAGACTLIAFGAKWRKLQPAPTDGETPRPEVSVEAKVEA